MNVFFVLVGIGNFRCSYFPHRRQKGSVDGGGTMASAEHESITGVWGQSPQRGPGAEPLVRGAKPP